ncbi:4-cresol dehydrogenase [hydroxylating] flavoprotein subunit [Fusarium oxysporum f. sp. albedinis]|nr:4-cresol dehydrogenase [hydroxylating] flavoprotein subunit [Fusarium oxysporum f. sp. albedinis]
MPTAGWMWQSGFDTACLVDQEVGAEQDFILPSDFSLFLLLSFATPVFGGALTGTPHSSASAEALCRGRHPYTSMTLRPQPPLFHGELQSLESLMRCNGHTFPIPSGTWHHQVFLFA